MIKCLNDGRNVKYYGYKRNPKGKTYTGVFFMIEREDRMEIGCSYIRHRNEGRVTQMLTEFFAEFHAQFQSEKPLFVYVSKENGNEISLYENVGFAIICTCNPNIYTMKYKGKEA